VHHSDREIDTSTAVRFHPLEIYISMLYKISVILILGPSAVLVIIFEIVLSSSAIFNHARVIKIMGLIFHFGTGVLAPT